MEGYIKIIDNNEVYSKDVKYVTFVLENCEYVKIPIENFTTLDINVSSHEGASLECVIESMNDIEYHSFANNWSPFERLTSFNDIASIELEFTDNTKKSIQPFWRGTDTTNYCQIGHMVTWDKISIIINEENVMKKMKNHCANKADRILETIYSDFTIDSCGDCCYKADCDKLRAENNTNICDILDIMRK